MCDGNRLVALNGGDSPDLIILAPCIHLANDLGDGAFHALEKFLGLFVEFLSLIFLGEWQVMSENQVAIVLNLFARNSAHDFVSNGDLGIDAVSAQEVLEAFDSSLTSCLIHS